MVMAEARRIAVAAPAKLNLFLHVTGRRADGRHSLASLVAFADWADWLTVAPDRDFKLAVTGPFSDQVPQDGSNLALQAARLGARYFGAQEGLAITLDKQLPVAAGLGGGSADAGAVLRAMAMLYGQAGAIETAMAAPELHTQAAALGADVPICLAASPAQMAGMGERLTPAPAPPVAGLLIAHPGTDVPTGAVFRRYRGAPREAAHPDFTVPRNAATFLADLASCRNDLAEAAADVAPASGSAVATLSGLPGARLARLSGSGASAFALFDSPAAARAASEVLRPRAPAWTIWAGGWADAQRRRPDWATPTAASRD